MDLRAADPVTSNSPRALGEPRASGGKARASASAQFETSLVIPVYGNEENIADLAQALADLSRTLGAGFEVVFVVDDSPDMSGELLLAERPSMPYQSQIVFHSRNFGSFTAIRTGLEVARGRYLAVMAADLQEPPELIARFVEILRADKADLVFGQRTGRNDSWLRDLFSRAFWSLYRKLVVRAVPRGGVDVFACTRQVRDVLLQIEEPNSSLVAQLFWLGFRRAFVPYQRRERTRGKSAWSFRRRLRYMMDSVFSFSDLPILAVLWVGLLGAAASLLFGAWLVIARLTGLIEVAGFTAIALLVVLFGSISLLVQGVIGSYLWRTFENTKRRPLRVIARVVRDVDGGSELGGSQGSETSELDVLAQHVRAPAPRPEGGTA